MVWAWAALTLTVCAWPGARCNHTRRVLSLRNNDLTSLSGIEGLTSLMELDVSSNDLRDIEALMQLVPRAPNLRMIDITDNDLRRDQVGRLREALQASAPACVLAQDIIH